MIDQCQVKPTDDKNETVTEEDTQQNKTTLYHLNQAKQREKKLIQLLAECQPGCIMDQKTFKSRIKNCFVSQHNREIFTNLILEMKTNTQQLKRECISLKSQLQEYKNGGQLNTYNQIRRPKCTLATEDSLLKSITNISNKQCSIIEKINSENRKGRMQSQPISPIKDFQIKLATLKDTIAIKKKDMNEMNTQLTEAVSRCQQYKQDLNTKNEQLQKSQHTINKLLEQNNELSERYQSLKVFSQKTAQLVKLETDKEIYELKQQLNKLQEENRLQTKPKEEQSAVFDPIVYRQNLSDRSQGEQQNSNSVRQSQDTKRQVKLLKQQLSDLLNLCMTNKQELQKDQFLTGIKQIIHSTRDIQGLVVFFKIFVDTSDQLRLNKKLTQFLQEVQRNIGIIYQNSEKIKEYTACMVQVTKRLKLLCNISISQIGLIEPENSSSNSVLKLLQGHN